MYTLKEYKSHVYCYSLYPLIPQTKTKCVLLRFCNSCLELNKNNNRSCCILEPLTKKSVPSVLFSSKVNIFDMQVYTTPKMLDDIYNMAKECKSGTHKRQKFCLEHCLMPAMKLMAQQEISEIDLHPTCKDEVFNAAVLDVLGAGIDSDAELDGTESIETDGDLPDLLTGTGSVRSTNRVAPIGGNQMQPDHAGWNLPTSPPDEEGQDPFDEVQNVESEVSSVNKLSVESKAGKRSIVMVHNPPAGLIKPPSTDDESLPEGRQVVTITGHQITVSTDGSKPSTPVGNNTRGRVDINSDQDQEIRFTKGGRGKIGTRVPNQQKRVGKIPPGDRLADLIDQLKDPLDLIINPDEDHDATVTDTGFLPEIGIRKPGWGSRQQQGKQKGTKKKPSNLQQQNLIRIRPVVWKQMQAVIRTEIPQNIKMYMKSVDDVMDSLHMCSGRQYVTGVKKLVTSMKLMTIKFQIALLEMESERLKSSTDSPPQPTVDRECANMFYKGVQQAKQRFGSNMIDPRCESMISNLVSSHTEKFPNRPDPTPTVGGWPVGELLRNLKGKQRETDVSVPDTDFPINMPILEDLIPRPYPGDISETDDFFDVFPVHEDFVDGYAPDPNDDGHATAIEPLDRVSPPGLIRNAASGFFERVGNKLSGKGRLNNWGFKLSQNFSEVSDQPEKADAMIQTLNGLIQRGADARE